MDDIEQLQERIAHLSRTSEELSDIVAAQQGRIERLERLVQQLRERAAEAELAAGGQIPLADQRPPHW